MTTIAVMSRPDDIKRMADAIAYLSAHYQRQPRLETVAATVGLSPYHFQRLFTRHAGVSPKAFIGHLTLSHAKRELADGASVLAAALEAGLSGPSRLHDLCLKIEAMTPGEYARGGVGTVVTYGYGFSPFGLAIIAATQKGICGIGFGTEGEEASMLADMKARWPKASFNSGDVSRWLAAVFGTNPAEIVPLHLMGTPFQIKVWQALLAIPSGHFSTYGSIAKVLDQPSASRAVGAAVGRNPISWLIPCHRVLGSSGALTGYHWGMERKRAMLALEKARLDQESPSKSAITSLML